MAYDTLSVYNRKSSEIKELDRVDTSLYSQESIREALVNSIVHCDYSQSAPSRIDVPEGGNSAFQFFTVEVELP